MRKLGNSPGRLCDITRRWEGRGFEGCKGQEGPFWGGERGEWSREGRARGKKAKNVVEEEEE